MNIKIICQYCNKEFRTKRQVYYVRKFCNKECSVAFRKEFNADVRMLKRLGNPEKKAMRQIYKCFSKPNKMTEQQINDVCSGWSANSRIVKKHLEYIDLMAVSSIAKYLINE